MSMPSTASNVTMAVRSSTGATAVTCARRGASSTGGTKAASKPSDSKKGRPAALCATNPPCRFFVLASTATSVQARI